MGTFLGMPMSQHWQDLFLWERFFEAYPFKTFIELGTDNGGLSTYFGLQCYQRHIRFTTFDNQDWKWYEKEIPLLLNLKYHFAHRDLFSQETKDFISQLLKDNEHPVCMFFDDGDKPREWSIYAPMTSIGDYLVVHDWEQEFFPKDLTGVKTTLLMNDLYVDRDAYKTRWFINDGLVKVVAQ